MQPLEGLDAAFLAMEGGNARLHVAAVLVLDPPEGRRSLFSPSTRFAQIRRLVEQRLHLVPQLRQRVLRVPLGLQHPAWVDDPDFHLDDHLRRARLPEPGGPAELEVMVAELVAQPLDPDRPLWEMVVVEGLAGDRVAVVAKVHHAVVDGVSGASLLAAFLDPGPRGRPVPIAGPAWAPAPSPAARDVLSYAATAVARAPGAALVALDRGLDAMVDVAGQNRRLAESGAAPPPSPFSAPRTPMNG
ncbi:MAG: wax ester/triacylglycerol synthase domain-containing protein, partial [Acidimicrobiales bacterium]